MDIKEFARRKNMEALERKDFACPCGCRKNKVSNTLIQWINDAYWLASQRHPIKFQVNSGYRCAEHNAAVGGSATSSHLKGEAVDLACTDSRTRFLIIKYLLDVGFERIGVGRTYIHADMDENKDPEVVWLY